jgi:excisionase family DNA binding protein
MTDVRSRSAQPTDDLMDTDQAARYLATSTRHVRRLVAERRLSYHKIGRFVRFRRRDLEAFIDCGRVEGRLQ